MPSFERGKIAELPGRDVLRGKSGERPRLKLPMPESAVRHARESSNDAVQHLRSAFEVSDDDPTEEIIELSSDDLEEIPAVDHSAHEVYGAVEASNTYRVERDAVGNPKIKKEDPFSAPSAESQTNQKQQEQALAANANSLFAEINKRASWLNEIDRNLAKLHHERMLLTPQQGQSHIYEKIQALDTDITNLNTARMTQEQEVGRLEHELTQNVTTREQLAASKATRARELDALNERMDLVKKLAGIEQQIASEAARSQPFEAALSEAMQRSQREYANLDALNSALKKGQGFFKRLLNNARVKQLESQRQTQEQKVVTANAAYQKAFEAIAAHNAIADALFTQQDKLKRKLSQMDQSK